MLVVMLVRLASLLILLDCYTDRGVDGWDSALPTIKS